MNQLSTKVPWTWPDDRWRRACEIVNERGYATRRRDGELVQRAVRCTRQLERARTDRAVRRAAMDYPDIYWALRLHQEDSTRVLELKARVLARQSDQVIAKLLGLPSRTVATFIALFFDVRPRLKATVWVRRVAIGLPIDQGPSVENLLLLSAWHNGPSIIPAWLDYLKHQEENHDLSTEVGRQRAAIEHLIRVHQLPFEAHCLRTLWKLSPFFLSKTSQAIQSTTVRATILQNRARILAEINWKEPDEQVFSEGNLPIVGEETVSEGEERRLTRAG